MSLNIKGCSCARCKAYLFEEDDVVYCPECGAPHHRECYNALNHCALEELHGTPEEYSRERKEEKFAEQKQTEKATEKEKNTAVKTCKICSAEYPYDKDRCPNCGTPDMSNISGFVPFDLLGGVPKDYVLDENVTANDAKLFVASNTHRYIPKFALLNKSKKASWNWMAFLFPCPWMLSRKMFKSGIIVGLLTVITTLFSYPLQLATYNLGLNTATSYFELINQLSDALPQIKTSIIIFSLLGSLFELTLRIVVAVFGDYIYKKHSLETIKNIKANGEDIGFEYRKRGGVNIFYFFLATLVLQYLSSFIMMFLS